MIGNDVVDILLARQQSNWKRTGFVEKIFTQEEKVHIKSAENPELYVWVLWSMKEAAYKIYNRATGVRAFIPHQLSCTINTFFQKSCTGSVTCNGNSYLTKTEIVNGIIHTVAVQQSVEDKNVVEVYGIVLKDSHGLPYILNRAGVRCLVSKSHHGETTRIVTFVD